MAPISQRRWASGAALLLLAAALAAGGQEPEGDGLFRAGLPWKNWALDIDLAGFGSPVGRDWPSAAALIPFGYWALGEPAEWFSEDGREYHLRVFRRGQKDARREVGLAVDMKPLSPVVGAEDFRAAELERIARASGKGTGVRFMLNRDSVKTSEYGGVPVARFSAWVEHDSPLYIGGMDTITTSKSQRLVAFYVNDGVGVAVSLSAGSIKGEEERLFYSVLDSVRLSDTSTPSSSFDHYHKGRLLFLQKDYGGAAQSLGRALTLERLQRQLDQKSWRDLVRKLTDAYGTNGDAARAKEVLDYGLAQEPGNPRFHLALARYHAISGDAEAALAGLSKAFALLKRENPRAYLPDLKYDSAFDRLLKDEKFARAVKALRK